jgi:hypothetical protein
VVGVESSPPPSPANDQEPERTPKSKEAKKEKSPLDKSRPP